MMSPGPPKIAARMMESCVPVSLAVAVGVLVDRCVDGGADGGLVGGPAGEERELFGGAAVGSGGVGDDDEVVAGELEGVTGEVDVSDDRVVERLVGAAVGAHVVAGPAAPELVAAGGQLADEVRQ